MSAFVSQIIGIWFYTALIYQGHTIPPMKPDLRMYFTFESNQVNELFYFYEGQNGFCKRKAEFKIIDGNLHQKVIFVDPDNADFCSDDVDMRMNHESVSKVEVFEDKLHLHLPLGEETIIYVWDRKN